MILREGACGRPLLFTACVKIVSGFATLASGTVTVTLSGNAAFSGNGTYVCTTNYAVVGSNPPANSPLPMGVYQLDGSQFVIRASDTGLSTVVTYICVGN